MCWFCWNLSVDIIIASILPWLTFEDPLKLFSNHLIGHVYCSVIKGSWAHFCSSLCFHLTCKSPFHHSQSYLMQQLVSAWAWKLLNCVFVQDLLFLCESQVSSIKKLKHCNTWCLGPDCNPKHTVPRVCFSLNHLIQNRRNGHLFQLFITSTES